MIIRGSTATMELMSSPGQSFWQDLGCLMPPPRGGELPDLVTATRWKRLVTDEDVETTEEPRAARAASTRSRSTSSAQLERRVFVAVAGVGERDLSRVLEVEGR